MSPPPTVDDLTARVDAELSSIVTSRQMPLYRMMAYHMGWNDETGHMSAGRQRIRGVLCLLACQACGGNVDTALPAAAAVELVDNFCQIHDDVQGGDPKRDDRDAVWWKWGPAQAINAGDGMHALARLALFRLLQGGVSDSITFRAIQLLDEASLRTCEGRFLDLEAQERIDLSVDAYLDMAASKTGALVSCAMKLGALVADAGEDVQDALGACGAKLGMAMQIRADVSEVWHEGQQSVALSTELMNKTKLLPVVYALEKASISEKRRLGEIYFKRVLEKDDVARLREALEQLGVREDCERLVEEYRTGALSALDTPGVSAEGRDRTADYVRSLVG